MSINISTSTYTKERKATIDGVDFVVRPLSSAETITLSGLASSLQNTDDNTPELAQRAGEIIGELEKIYFGVFDKPQKAKTILGHLPIDAWVDIYNKIMSEDN